MQPHSMCMVSLANVIWNFPQQVIPKSLRARVEYTNHYRESKSLLYDIEYITIADDRTTARARVVRQGGGVSCTMELRRFGRDEGALVRITHEPEHVAGLHEEFKLWKKSIKSGMHSNSQRYGRFEGDVFSYASRLRLECELKQKDGSFMVAPYDLTLYGLES